MKNKLLINHANRTIIMDRTFAKYAANTRSEEYAHLQRVRQDYPEYEVIRRKINSNNNKETYTACSYSLMSACYLLDHHGFDWKCAVLDKSETLVYDDETDTHLPQSFS